MGFRTGIVGASGYAGGELIRLVAEHPDLELSFLGAHSRAGEQLSRVHPQLALPDRELQSFADLDPGEVDIVFLALPHGASAEPAHRLVAQGVKVVDLGSDFRLDDDDRYREAYGAPHPYPDELVDWVYGLPELFGDRLAGAAQVAVPGCYPTAALLALAPLLREGLIDPAGIVVDALSGVSGAGRGTKSGLMYGAVSEGTSAYQVLTHRHRPEIEQGLEAASGQSPTVLFTPHLIPMQRGLLATCYADSVSGTHAGDVRDALHAAYKGARFVQLLDQPPQTRWVVGSNNCLLAAWRDARSGKVIIISAIDNLIKGAAGQAVQCANVMLDLADDTGLPTQGWMP